MQRLFAFALTLGITAAPLALTMCQVVCAATPSTAQHHSCHAEPAPGAATVTAVPHACGHDGDSPAGVDDRVLPWTAPVAVVPVVTWTLPVEHGRALSSVPASHSPPGPPPRITHLRV